MKFIIFLSFLMCAFAEKGKLRKRIINGSPIKIRKVPYFASLVTWDANLKAWEPVCGSSILSEYWQVSTAFCVRPEVIYDRKVRTAFHTFYWLFSEHPGKRIHDIAFSITHPDYQSHSCKQSNDIGLLKLVNPLTLKRNKQWPIKLPDPDYVLIPDSKLKIVGFGLQTLTRTKKKDFFPTKLLSAKLKIVDREICQEILSNHTIPSTTFCATSKDQMPALLDAGGPAVQKRLLTGIINSGSCTSLEEPDLFTEVSKFVYWIKNIMAIKDLIPKNVSLFTVF